MIIHQFTVSKIVNVVVSVIVLPSAGHPTMLLAASVGKSELEHWSVDFLI